MLQVNRTRMRILKKLEKRSYTASELARTLGITRQLVYYHLLILERAKLVRRIERGKWVYYELTELGERILNLMKNIEKFHSTATTARLIFPISLVHRNIQTGVRYF